MVRLLSEGWTGVFKCHNHGSTEEEKWKCHRLTSCLTELLQTWKIHLGGRRRKDKGISRKMMVLMLRLLREAQITSRWEEGAIIIITVWINVMCLRPSAPPPRLLRFSPTHLLNRSDIRDIYLHSIWEEAVKIFTALFPASMLLACEIIAAFKISRLHTVSEPQKAFCLKNFHFMVS